MSRKNFGALAALALAFAPISRPARAQGLVQWAGSFEQALVDGQARGQVVLLDFSADWCPPCRAMDEKVWTNAELASMLQRRVVAVRIDFDSEKKLARRFDVRAIPTLIWADPWGNELGRNLGFTSASILLSVIDSLPADFQRLASYHEILFRFPDQAVAFVRIASAYREMGFLIAADSFYEKALVAAKNGKKEPQVAEQAYVGLGLNMLARKNARKAKRMFEKASKLPPGPNRANALYGLVASHVELGDGEKAARVLEELRAAWPNDEKLQAAEALVAAIKKP